MHKDNRKALPFTGQGHNYVPCACLPCQDVSPSLKPGTFDRESTRMGYKNNKRRKNKFFLLSFIISSLLITAGKKEATMKITETTANSKNLTLSKLAYAFYTDDIFQIAEHTNTLISAGMTPEEIDNKIEKEFNERFRNNPHRERRHKKNYR